MTGRIVQARSTASALVFTPLELRSVVLRNRIVVSPMCQYSAVDGFAGDWHLVHLGRFALGGAGLVFVEQTAVHPIGRVSHGDLGLWCDEQVPALRRVARFLKEQGAAAGIQLGHAGRKGSRARPWVGYQPLSKDGTGEVPWTLVGPTTDPAGDGWPAPRALEFDEVQDIVFAFAEAARRANAADFDVLEIHAAHGYLLHSFLSPLSNRRADEYGGEREGRMLFALNVARAVRTTWPEHKPLIFRLSVVDGPDIGWSIQDSVALSRELAKLGVDLIDCSSGGVIVPAHTTRNPLSHASQVPYAAAVRSGAGVRTIAVGMITEAEQAESILRDGQADLIAIAREMLFDPNWPLHAARQLGIDPDFALWPRQFATWLQRREQQRERGHTEALQ